jgi:hypothetical protein
MKTYWGVEVQLYALLPLKEDGGEWLASRPACFAPGGKTSRRYQLVMRLGRAQSRSAHSGGDKKENRYPGRPVRRLVTVLTELPRLLVSEISACKCFSLFISVNAPTSVAVCRTSVGSHEPPLVLCGA